MKAKVVPQREEIKKLTKERNELEDLANKKSF